MAKLLFILLLAGAFADQVASTGREPPLLIDPAPPISTTASLDGAD